jgi:predicted SAM-dependent methyltransferase
MIDRKRFISKVSKLASRFGFGPGKSLNLAQAISQNVDMRRLHLGCGHIHADSWCNVDVLATGATDLVMDISSLPGVMNDSVEMIYSCHVLEHFAGKEIPPILERWRQVLKPGGEIRISVPDLDAITRIYQKHIAHFQVSGNQPWIALIYGGQKDAYDFHKTGFNYCWLKFLLEQAGFKDVERYKHIPHFIPGLIDNSIADAPFGELISLNVRALK